MAHLLADAERDEIRRRRRLNILCLALGVLTVVGLLSYPIVLFLYDLATNGWGDF